MYTIDIMRKTERLAQLEKLKKIRQKLAQKGVVSDSVSKLRRMMQERTNHLSSLK